MAGGDMEVKLNRDARKDFDALAPTVKLAVLEEKRRLKLWPDVPGVKHLTGRWVGFARVKVMRDWRMIFRPLTDHVVIVRIRHRSVVYL
jgi:mRNA-degrading endonuclease RelE of RelBE toxin-antitoxin system